MPNNEPAAKNTPVYDNVKSYKRPANGGPAIADRPRTQLINPNVVVNNSNDKISTNMIDVNDMYDAIFFLN